MKTTSVYKKPAYLVHFGEGDDFIEFDLEVHITKDVTSYSLEIVKAAISPVTMPFAARMFQKLDVNTQEMYHSLFRQLITADMEPHLHSYYHEGELLNGDQSKAV